MVSIRWVLSLSTVGLLAAVAVPPPGAAAQGSRFRSIDGSGNSRRDPEMGMAGSPLRRWMAPDYADGTSEMPGADRPGPREISNAVNHQVGSRPNPYGASDYLWQWGQFVDHDIGLTGGADPAEPAAVAVPAGDPWFDPFWTGEVAIPFDRSVYDEATGDHPARPRAQLNQITAWIDASNVYGSDPERAAALRTNDGTGRLATSAGDLLPFNTAGLPNAGGPSASLFLAGDVRANEQSGLTAMHTLFVREHNRLAAIMALRNPSLDGDKIYERARRLVGAQMQVITYREFLPALLGPRALAPYRGYRRRVDARIANLFSTAAYRFGHSALSPLLLRVGPDGQEVPEGHLALRDAFFAPHRLQEAGIEPILRGLARQVCQAIDVFVIDDVRNFLFGPPGAGGFDLASLNIQRGRDHGLPSYNAARHALGLPEAKGFDDISRDPEVQARLAVAYDSVDEVDLWVGGLAEERLPHSHLGPTFHLAVKRQFEALRDGDRFWYQLRLGPRQQRRLERTRLSDIIRRNTSIGPELQRDVFHAAP